MQSIPILDALDSSFYLQSDESNTQLLSIIRNDEGYYANVDANPANAELIKSYKKSYVSNVETEETETKDAMLQVFQSIQADLALIPNATKFYLVYPILRFIKERLPDDPPLQVSYDIMVQGYFK